MEHPAVAQAAVTGVPDGWPATKVPRSVTFLDALPLYATGKVMKDQLC